MVPKRFIGYPPPPHTHTNRKQGTSFLAPAFKLIPYRTHPSHAPLMPLFFVPLVAAFCPMRQPPLAFQAMAPSARTTVEEMCPVLFRWGIAVFQVYLPTAALSI